MRHARRDGVTREERELRFRDDRGALFSSRSIRNTRINVHAPRARARTHARAHIHARSITREDTDVNSEIRLDRDSLSDYVFAADAASVR